MRMKFYIPHYLTFFLLKVIQIWLVDSTCSLTPRVKFPDGKFQNKRLEGLGVVTTTEETAMKCFALCVENCQCKSINYCGKECQLNSGNQANKALSDSSDCSYYELSWEQGGTVSRPNLHLIRQILIC